MARILDLTTTAGAYGTRLLAELGHDVVRVEHPSGDALRTLSPRLGGGDNRESGAFHQFLNAGKRSITADVTSPEGRRMLVALAAKADALVATLPLPVEESDLRAANPALILVCVDPGESELTVYARSGLLAITGEPDGRPTPLGGHVPYAAVGIYVAMAAAAALFAKGRGGGPTRVDVSAPHCLAALAEQVFVEFDSAGELLERLGSRGGITALAGALPCADGHWMVSVPPDQKGWENFVALVPDPAFKDDTSLADEAARRDRKHEILDRIAAWSTGRRKDDIVEEAQGRAIPAAAVNTPLDLVHDPQLRARGFLREVAHPIFGSIPFPVGALATLWNQPMSFAPRLGEHTDVILSELARGASDTQGASQ